MRVLSYGKIGLSTVAVTRGWIFKKNELIDLWNRILPEQGQHSATACKNTKHTLSR